MVDPLFWLGFSILLVAVSLTAVLMAALPAFRELARAARSAEKLFDTLHRELPPTLEAIRLTSMEITELTDDMTEGVQNVGRMTQQVDQGVSGAKQQAKQAQITTRSLVAGVKAALGVLTRPANRRPAPVPMRPGLEAVEEIDELEELEELKEFEELEELEANSISLSNSSAVPGKHSSHLAPGELASAAIHPDANEHAPDRLSHNGSSHGSSHSVAHAPQLRGSDAPPLNLPPAPQIASPVEAHRDRQH